MSVADYIKNLSATELSMADEQAQEAGKLLRELAEVEAVLRDIGASLEPRIFDISLAARIGADSSRQPGSVSG